MNALYLISIFSCCHCGAGKGQLDTLKVLAKSGANLWLKNQRGDLPLHEAVHSGRKDLVRWLLNQRPDATDASNNDGRCPLHIAAINNHVEMCKVKNIFCLRCLPTTKIRWVQKHCYTKNDLWK